MSRWTENYMNHPFQLLWNVLKANLDKANADDKTVITTVAEVARLKKVIEYINSMVNSIDPELVPLNTWDSFYSQAILCNQHIENFNSIRDISQLQSANSHADNLLTYIRPYMLIEGKAGRALLESAKQYLKTIDEYIGSFQSKSIVLLNEIRNIKQETDTLQSNIQTTDALVEQFKEKLFDDNEKTLSIKSKIDNFVEAIEKNINEVNVLHDEMLVGDDKNPSTKSVMTLAKQKVLSDQKSIDDALNAVNGEVKELDTFHTKIFGKTNDDGKLEGGLADELDKRVRALSDFESKQIIKYNTLNEQIETLLPGATSAGLATAYKTMKESFDDPIKKATFVYYLSIGLLLVASFLFSIESIGGETLISFVQFANWDAVLKGLAYRMPIYGAIIWLAYVASKRRSESQRLQQEYAHKEALAKSYDSYKTQLESLDNEDKLMQKAFIMKTIDAIAYNASQTLDGKHGDNHPTFDLVGKILNTVTEIKGAVTK